MFTHPHVPDSPIARWDTRWKLAAIVAAAAGTAAITKLAPASVALAVGLSLIALSRLPAHRVLGRMALFAFAALPFLILLPFTLDLSGAGWSIGPVRVSEQGLIAGLAVFTRCLAIGSLAMVLTDTAPMHLTLAAAHRLRIPGLLLLLMGMAYRYTFLLASELRRVRIALRCRGFRIKANRHGYRTTGHLVGAVLVRGADRADRVSEAMRCRGFDGSFHTTTTFRSTPTDIILFTLIIAITVALLIWDRY